MSAATIALLQPPALPLAYSISLAYGTVLSAELVGDKSLYTISSLVLRFRVAIVVVAMVAAFVGKMLAAVLLGALVVQIPAVWAGGVSAAAFFASGVFIWREEPVDTAADARNEGSAFHAALVCFASLFLPEWGDPGQLAAAALTVQSRSPLGPWLGGTLALLTKGGLALTLSLKLRERIPKRLLRTLASLSCFLLGTIALLEVVMHRG